MVLKKEMAQESVQLEKKIKRLENKVKKLKDDIEKNEELEEYRIKTLIREREEKEELRNKIFELEQQLDAQETKGPLYQICDPSLHRDHIYRDAGVDVYVEGHMPSQKKKLLTRIPINVDSEVWERMTFEQRAALLDPLVQGLKIAYAKCEDPIVHIRASLNEMQWTDD
jgi:predicted nuclease with TOPRIM domain